MTGALALVLVLDLDDPREGDPQTDAARAVVRDVGEAIRFRPFDVGVRLRNVASALHCPDTTSPTP